MSALLHYAQCGKILYFGIAFALVCPVEVLVRHKKKDGNHAKWYFLTKIVLTYCEKKLF